MRDRNRRQECASLLQIGGIEAFSKPGIEVAQSLSTFSSCIFLLIKKLQAHPNTQFPRLCPLFLCDPESLGEAGMCLSHEWRAAGCHGVGSLHDPFALQAMKFCRRVAFSCSFGELDPLVHD